MVGYDAKMAATYALLQQCDDKKLQMRIVAENLSFENIVKMNGGGHGAVGWAKITKSQNPPMSILYVVTLTPMIIMSPFLSP